MNSCQKNSYLQGICGINGKLLNRSVQKAFNGIIDECNCYLPFNRLTSEQPTIPVKNIDVTRRQEAYGRRAIPKIKRELHDKDIQVVLAALSTLCDLVYYPEHAYQAINLRIIDRTVSLLLHESSAIRERTMNLLTILGGHLFGKEAIIDNADVLMNILCGVNDEYPEVRIHTAACLEMLARFWRAADRLNETGAIEILLANLIDQDEIVEIHLETLKSLLYCDGKEIALENEAFSILMMNLLEEIEPKIIAKSCEILTILCHIIKGREMAKNLNLLPVLNRLLFYEDENVHTAAAEALIYCTIDSSQKKYAATFKTIPKRLVQLCRNKLNSKTQIFAIKALTSLCEYPVMRNEVNTYYLNDIKSIQLSVDVPELKTYKKTLLTVLQWLPYSNECLENE